MALITDFSIIIFIMIYFTFSFISVITLILLVHAYWKDKHKEYSIHSLTKLLIMLTFFLSFMGIYNFVLHLSQYNLIWPALFFKMSEVNFELIPNLGIL